ncbi:MAG: hydroxymethylbilane synthase [Deltaproteobacteria bacterium RIFCSPLOWO2_01_44_7]|nr:MAG: hydroxymethylbilane synthase [Deltaproteobacteria bacterium RIFCSPHIGHO2_01_FULL_43_49]OGQ16395.1 MAG: hydroxymethylbilane synthase [Deltaproteobacteria bacterium RIFCSPHIGHO2_02_FULL_44_53]OGQ27779.1 MAG: hydroxymethylbilane synthase [Deltaproteobacteria bacterium RIFCSPHIGHO2_12_FULL_44_21]OGQ32913.1 MAG: hydroxymethylbilane synthase [Deltaproteobacteria bacterium RIFCSPLOWO2_01_FULL_45_74]OGQ41646.1 MAG: hydroxymethylbilane synthase [Deltaproteobacteria bacterium RIFCSPLOWO2_01_44_7]
MKLGTRNSPLALAQTQLVVSALKAKFPVIEIETITIQTSGDRFQGERIADAGGKALFVKEIEEALLKNEIDFAVHSLKDLPGFLPDDLTLCCYPKREDPRDCFLSKKFSSFEELPKAAKVGTTSPRRKAQLLKLRPDLKIEPIRGNVETRLKKLETENFDAIILAAAGLRRLGRENVVTQYFEPDVLIPAVGQGVLGIEIRKVDERLKAFLSSALNDETTALTARAERAFLAACGGDCYTPLAGYAWIENEALYMMAGLGNTEGTKFVRSQRSSKLDQPEKLGETLAKEVLNALTSHKTS